MYNHNIVDAHIHLTEDGSWMSDGYNASYERLAIEMEQSQVDRGVLLSLDEFNQDEFIANICRKSEGTLFALAGFSPKEKSLERISSLMDEKSIFKGVKLHPRMGNFSPLDERLFPFYEEAEGRGWVINFDSMGHSAKLPMEEIRPTVFDRLAKKYPKLKIILSHCGVPWIMEAFFVAKSNENIYLDCSFIIDKFEASSIYKDLLYIATHLDRKLLYGSDFPEREINRYLSLAKVAFTDLSIDKQQNILGNNAIKLFGLNETK